MTRLRNLCWSRKRTRELASEITADRNVPQALNPTGNLNPWVPDWTGGVGLEPAIRAVSILHLTAFNATKNPGRLGTIESTLLGLLHCLASVSQIQSNSQPFQIKPIIRLAAGYNLPCSSHTSEAPRAIGETISHNRIIKKLGGWIAYEGHRHSSYARL